MSEEVTAQEPPLFFAPLLWPLASVFDAIRQPTQLKVRKASGKPRYNAFDHVVVFAASVRTFFLSWLLMFYLYSEDTPYPAFGPAKTIHVGWMLPILLRNVIGCWLICGFWDWFLYFSPWQQKLHKFKFNPTYPSLSQFRHDALHSTIASVCATAIEVALCHAWANGHLTIRHHNVSEAPLLYVTMAILIKHLRVPHFYAIHRVMHPWRIPGVPDIGKFLYRHVHSVHHKSYNPTAFSGTSMHFVEATVYYSAALIPALFGLHPIVSLSWLVDLGFGAWMGHDGFQWPGSGDYFHQLHHEHFDCNYGTGHIPIDQWFGTYAASKEDVRKLVRENKSKPQPVNENR